MVAWLPGDYEEGQALDWAFALPGMTDLRTHLYELGPVTIGAYSGATAGLSTGEHPPRSATLGMSTAPRRARRKP